MKHLLSLTVLAMAFAVHATLYRAGLKGGFINSFEDGKYTTVAIADTGVFPSVEAGGIKTDSNNSKTYPPVWVDNRTWRYHGQMYFTGETYYFAESVDDRAWMALDGVPILQDATWNNVGVTAAQTPSAGWHDVEIRFGNGTGGAGVPYDSTLDANGRLCGFGVAHYQTAPETAPTAMSDFVFVENTEGNSWLRCAEDGSCIKLNTITPTDNGYSVSVTLTSPSPATVTLYAGETAGAPEAATGWAFDSGELAFAANETKTIDVVGSFTTEPCFVLHLSGVGTTAAEGVGIPFWEWTDIMTCTMNPTVAVELAAATDSAGTFNVTLDYDKVVTGMELPPFELVAYYGQNDAGPQTTGWKDSVSFGSANASGTSSRTLPNLSPDMPYAVRFAAKTPDSDWVWSDAILFWTEGLTFDAKASRFCATVSFPGYTLDGPVENFPVLVRLTESEDGFSYADSSADGSDLRFVSADGSALFSEVALWNPQGESLVWVSVPVLDVGTTIQMYWGGHRDFLQSQTDGSVWTKAGYFGVWHLDEAADSTIAKDSAGGALDGTHYGTAPGQDGVVGRSVRISSGGWNVSDNKGISTASYSGVGDTFMVSLWTKYPNQNPGTDRFLSKKAYYSDANGWELSTMRYNQSQIDFRGSGAASVEPPLALKNTSWQYLTFVYQGSKGTLYVNNEWRREGSIAAVVENDLVLVIGNIPGPDGTPTGDSYKGWLDEVRLYRGAPSRNWISTEYNSIHDPAFAVVGTREALPNPGTLLILF